MLFFRLSPLVSLIRPRVSATKLEHAASLWRIRVFVVAGAERGRDAD